ncbi:MAG: ATP-binding cassette domain-containing protein [Bacteroidetes bacterium]|nr:ATP-binding cassette domain-containing protein [Bacteroidota bacterium]
MLQIINLKKIFKIQNNHNIAAIKNINFNCRKGQITGLIGPNGAGKTTTLRIISTIMNPTEGTVLFNNIDVRKEPNEIRRRIGFLTGSTGLYPNLTSIEILNFFCSLYEVDKKKKVITDLIEMLDMESFVNKKVDSLSTGMRQKLSIARTILHNPEFFILDEPMNGLDVLTSQSIRNFIIHEKKKGKCILLSTHNMHEAEHICDEIVLLHKGSIVTQGVPSELIEKEKMKNLEEVFLNFIGN